jgi:uncharacterized protein (DUF362 family)
MTVKATVCVTEIRGDLTGAIAKCFDAFGGIDSICKGEVFIKINALMPDTTAMTDIDVILETVALVKEARPKPKKIYVFDSAGVSFPTRVVFMIEDLAKRIKKLGAIPLYLDEQPSIDMDFQGKALDYPVPIPRILYEKLILHKEENTYINIPKLKCHLQTQMTACLKNQHGLLYDKEKVYNHHMMHDKIVEIYSLFQPDFNLVEAINVTNHANFAYRADWAINYDLLLAGTDAVAVDSVGARLIGMDGREVEHLRLAQERGLGTCFYEEIEVVPDRALVEKKKKTLNNRIDQVPVEAAEGVTFIPGKERCVAGCGYIEFWIKYITASVKSKPFVAVVGKDHDTAELDKYPGPFFVNGPCPVKELKGYFDQRKKSDRKLKVVYVDDHFDLIRSMMGVMKAGGIPMKSLMDMLKIPKSKMMIGFAGAIAHRARFKAM